MNVENIISALQNAQTVAVVFTGTPNKTYTYKVPKSWEVKVGDELVVRSPIDGSTIVKVKEVHDTCDIDLSATFTYKWAVSKVDNEAYEAKVAAEKENAKQLKALQRKAELKKQLATIAAELGDEAEEFLKSLTAR